MQGLEKDNAVAIRRIIDISWNGTIAATSTASSTVDLTATSTATTTASSTVDLSATSTATTTDVIASSTGNVVASDSATAVQIHRLQSLI